MIKILIIGFMLVFLSLAPVLAGDQRPSAEDFRAANKLFASSRFSEAISLYQKVLVAPPPGVTAGEIQSRIGDSWFRLADYQNALRAYRTAIRTQKESQRPETQYWIGFCCFLLGRDGEAVDELLKIPSFYPDAAIWISTAYYWAGRACERMGKPEEAREYYRLAGGNGRSTQGKFAQESASGKEVTSLKLQGSK